MPTSIKALGIGPDDFERALPEIIRAAYDDISIRSNPRMPLLRARRRSARRFPSGRRAAAPSGFAFLEKRSQRRIENGGFEVLNDVGGYINKC